MDDILELDPRVLYETADDIGFYCETQTQVMADYLSKMGALQSEWDDDQTIGPLLEEVRTLKSRIESIMNDIKREYPRFFREKARLIESRPEDIG
ncbi:MAG: hypothetical protein IJF11_05550 [Clostridia bacterium]|nr:hypothetical protein [Clostridia bacterium]